MGAGLEGLYRLRHETLYPVKLYKKIETTDMDGFYHVDNEDIDYYNTGRSKAKCTCRNG